MRGLWLLVLAGTCGAMRAGGWRPGSAGARSVLVVASSAPPTSWFVKTETFVKSKSFGEIRPHLEAHKEWVARLRAAGEVVTSGYRVDADGRPGGGGLMIFAAADHAAAEHLVRQDPLITAGVRAAAIQYIIDTSAPP